MAGVGKMNEASGVNSKGRKAHTAFLGYGQSRKSPKDNRKSH